MMTRIAFRRLALVGALAATLIPFSMSAQDAAATFKSKCAACHGADGTGSNMGKKMGAHDFTSADVQKMSDAELADIITNGKNKMPKYASLSPEVVKGIVAYIIVNEFENIPQNVFQNGVFFWIFLDVLRLSGCSLCPVDFELPSLPEIVRVNSCRCTFALKQC